MSDSHSNWRKSLPRSDRIQVCYHIFAKLRSYFPDIPEPALKQKTSRFETQAYINALSRRDYLDQIAEVLSKAESRKRRSSPPQSSPTKRARSTSPPSPPNQHPSWRTSVSRDDRVNACHYIVRNVDAMHPNLPHAAVIHMVSTFERQCFVKAASRRDYIQRISRGLNKLRSHPALRGRAARHHVAHVTAQNRAPSCATNVSGASNTTSTSRTTSPQMVPLSLLDESEEEMDWRVGLTRRERVERCGRILRELTSCYADLGEEALKEKTRAFEEQAFGRATNREEYDGAITAGLAMLRKQVGDRGEGGSDKKLRAEKKSGQGDDAAAVSGDEGEAKRSWRKELAREERVESCQRMLVKLNVYYPGVNEQLMKEKVSEFECCAFAHATGRGDYYAKIEEGLTKVEEKMMGKTKGKERVERDGRLDVKNKLASEIDEVGDENKQVEEEEDVEGRIDMPEEGSDVGEESDAVKENGGNVGEEIEEMRKVWEDEEEERKEDKVTDEDLGEWLGCEDELTLGEDMSWLKDDMSFPLDAAV